MKKVFARLVNVVAVIAFVYGAIGIYWYFVESDVAGFGVAGALVVIVLFLNYVFLGKAKIWNNVEQIQ